MEFDLKEIKGLESALNEIINKIFFPLKNAAIDFEYLHTFKGDDIYFFQKYSFASSRLQFYAGVCVILHINKLFNKEEETSLSVLLEEMQRLHKDSKWKDKIQIIDIKDYFRNLRSKNTRDLFKKVLTTRHKFYAHLDKKHSEIDFTKIQLGPNEINAFVNLAETILQDLELRIFGRSTIIGFSKQEMGNIYIEELKDYAKMKYEKSIITNII